MPDVLHEELGKKIRNRRIRRDYTQDELSKRVQISRTSLTNMERGRQRILVEQLYRIAKALEVEPAELLPTARELARANSDSAPSEVVPLSVQRFVDRVGRSSP